MDTLCGVHLESTWSPSGVHQDCIWSLPGVQTQYQEFTWTPDGVHQDPWGSVTYSRVDWPGDDRVAGNAELLQPGAGVIGGFHGPCEWQAACCHPIPFQILCLIVLISLFFFPV